MTQQQKMGLTRKTKANKKDRGSDIVCNEGGHGVLTVGQCGPINTHPGGQLFIKIELFWGRNPLKAKRIFEGKWIF